MGGHHGRGPYLGRLGGPLALGVPQLEASDVARMPIHANSSLPPWADPPQAGRSAALPAIGSLRSFRRRRSWALAATMIVERLIAIAPTAIGRSMPHGTKTPAATGMATRLYAVAHTRFW